jgi:hypothetical protein
MTTSRVEAMRLLCADLDDSIQMAIENRLPIRVVALIELARANLQCCVDDIEEREGSVIEMRLEAKKVTNETSSLLGTQQ